MPDERLVGYWSDETLFQGAMEAADIAFRPDGTGWTYWSRDGGAFDVHRFSWHTAADRQLTLDLHKYLWGTWDIQEHRVRHFVRTQDACNDRLVFPYRILGGQDVLRRPATLLELNEPVSLGTIGDRFARKRELAEDEQDPAAQSA